MRKVHVVTVKAMSLCIEHLLVIKPFLSNPEKSHHSKIILPQACAHPRMLFPGCPESFFLFYPFSCQFWKQKHKWVWVNVQVMLSSLIQFLAVVFNPKTKNFRNQHFLYNDVILTLARAHAMNKVTLMFTPTWVKRDFPINVEKFNSCFSSGKENFSWYTVPILWFDKLGKFVVFSVLGDPPWPLYSRWGSWLVLKWIPHQETPLHPNTPAAPLAWLQISKGHLSQTFPAATAWAALVVTPP